MIFIFYQLITSECSYTIDSKYGLFNFRQQAKRGEEICVNISIFPFYFLLNEVPDDIIIYHYKSFITTSDLSLYGNYTGDNIPNYILIRNPFSSITIRFKKDGIISFSYGAFNGICKTSVYFSNKKNVSLDLSNTKNSDIKVTNINEDICIILTNQALQNVTVKKMSSGIMFYYKSNNFNDYNLFTDDKINFNLINNGNEIPLILRYLSPNKVKKEDINIIMKSESFKQLKEWEKYIEISRNDYKKEKCSILNKINMKTILTILGFTLLGIIIFVILIYISALCFCPTFIEIQKIKDESAEINKTISKDALISKEPLGYFAMDPILKSMQND